ncbi:MAG: suppressor of fused domain protein [Crocinitomicaceae bacterium]
MAEKLADTMLICSEKTIGDCAVDIYYYKPTVQSNGVLFTDGLRHHNQHELAGQTENIYQAIELYFLLPSHWSLEKENQKWPIAVLQRLIAGQREQKAWFGPGDTLTAHPKSKDSSSIPLSINNQFKQNHFILTEPVAATELLENRIEGDLTWLAIVPIFQKEFEYKNSRSALELMMNFQKKNITEEIDEYRKVAARRKFFGLF